MPNWARLVREIRRLEASRAGSPAGPSDRLRVAWYAAGCPCGLPAGECREHPRARPSQRPPAGAWRTWLVLAGRGFGKTRCAAEWVRHRVEAGRARRLALVGATAADVRDTMVEGESGLLAVCPPWNRPIYQPSMRRLTWPDGARATTFSAEEPERLRGPQHDGAWMAQTQHSCHEGQSSKPKTVKLGRRDGRRPSVRPQRISPLRLALRNHPRFQVIDRSSSFDLAS